MATGDAPEQEVCTAAQTRLHAERSSGSTRKWIRDMLQIIALHRADVLRIHGVPTPRHMVTCTYLARKLSLGTVFYGHIRVGPLRCGGRDWRARTSPQHVHLCNTPLRCRDMYVYLVATIRAGTLHRSLWHPTGVLRLPAWLTHVSVSYARLPVWKKTSRQTCRAQRHTIVSQAASCTCSPRLCSISAV